MVLENLNYIHVEGSIGNGEIIVIGSSSCEFFQAAESLLKEMDIGYSYILLDKVKPVVRTEVTQYLKKSFTKEILCPFLIMERKKHISGFNRELWREKLESSLHQR